MKPYRVQATMDQVGMIEIVRNSETIAAIHRKYGGTIGAFSETTIIDFLKHHNPDNLAYDNATENFIRSCAGYCVATFVLGIGDRHSDNIMVTKFGHLFHIDFGHILGHFKEKGGFKRGIA
jgi:phosphatidylinositol-4,5-bisphosphate 3-kinase